VKNRDIFPTLSLKPVSRVSTNKAQHSTLGFAKKAALERE